MDAIASKLTTTTTPDGKTIRLPPMATDLKGSAIEYSFAPRYSEHTKNVLLEAGLSREGIDDLKEGGIIPS